MAAAGAIAPGGGGSDEAARAVPHLDDGVVSEFLHRLPTKDAYRLTAVCRRWRALIASPAFLSRHLSPRPLPPHLDDLPDALILQPQKRLGYTHLTLVSTDPAVRVALNLPLLPKYTDGERYRPKPPPPSTPVMQLGDQAAAFFERTVPMLDFTIAASHGRLLLGRGRARYFVCDPAANRWLALPPPAAIPPTRDTACGFHYDAADGRVSFTVVLLARARSRRVLVETFSSATGRWATAATLDAQGVSRCLGGAASPGIRVGACFYWLSQRRGRVVRYDAARGRAAVVREPPNAEGSEERMARSLGSAGGRLRLCGFDIRDDEPHCAMPHNGLEGVHGVWEMDDAGGGGAWAWRRVHEAVVEDIQAWYFKRLFGHETPLDFAGAPRGRIVVNKDHFLLRYDLESGEKVELFSIYRDDGNLGALYHRFHAFPFYRSG